MGRYRIGFCWHVCAGAFLHRNVDSFVRRFSAMNKDIFAGIRRERMDWWLREYSENKLEYIAIMVAVVVLLAAVGMARAV